jgi:glutaminyl-peptide cyclotransferase
MPSRIAAACLAALALAASAPAQGPGAAPALYGYRLTRSYPHDSRAFTQGLVYRDGFFYESTGRQGQSTVRKVEVATGRVVRRHDVDPKYFAEGLAEFGASLFQLTWLDGLGFVYDRETFALQRTFTYTGEGWGLATDGTHLILSDGSATGTIRFFDPQTFREVRRIAVQDRGRPVDDLNELEFVRGELFANVWHADRIARIHPGTGAVTGWIDLAGLRPTSTLADADAVLNGIAYDAAGDRLFVTGKLWPTVFEITLERRR